MKLFEITHYNISPVGHEIITNKLYIGMWMDGHIYFTHSLKPLHPTLIDYEVILKELQFIKDNLTNCSSFGIDTGLCVFKVIFDPDSPRIKLLVGENDWFVFNVGLYNELQVLVSEIIESFVYIDKNYKSIRDKQLDLMKKGVLKYD